MILPIMITVAYAALLLWGFGVGARQIYQGFRRPGQLLNPLFANRVAITLFTVHIVVVTLDLFVVGPWALAHKSTLWYWGGRIALLTSSMPIAAYLNRNPQSFGTLIGRWVTVRNIFEYTVHVVVAALPPNWFSYYVLLWWLVAYRYLDVGPRRALQKLYATPELRAARPWAPVLNWGVIVILYLLALLVVWNQQVLFARVPDPATAEHVPAFWEGAVVIGSNLALVLFAWVASRRYADSVRPPQRPGSRVPAGH